MGYIKDSNENTFTDNNAIMKRWKEQFEEITRTTKWREGIKQYN